VKILVATDLSAPSDEAVRQAHARAKPGDQLAVVHVIPNLQPVAPLFPQSTQQTILDVAALPARAEEAVRDRVAELTGRSDDAFEVFIEQGVDYAEVARRAAAWHADLVVIGSRGSTGLERVLLGSVAERVARYATCPVLVARHVPDASAKGPVVAATDLSDPSLPALEAAVREASHLGAPLVAVHAVDAGPTNLLYGAGLLTGTVPFALLPGVIDQLKSAAKAALTEAMDTAKASGEARVDVGDAAAAVVRAAIESHARLVVVATHGRTGLRRVAMGSVAEAIVRTAPCPVLVTRHVDHAHASH
jgi:nucleotide-binding universal stress UspA family protein